MKILKLYLPLVLLLSNVTLFSSENENPKPLEPITTKVLLTPDGKIADPLTYEEGIDKAAQGEGVFFYFNPLTGRRLGRNEIRRFMLGDLVSVNQELREYHYWKTLGHPGATEELFHELTEKKKLIEEQHRRLKKGVKEIHTKVEERKKVIAQQEDEKTLASFYEENVEDGFLSFDKVLVQEKAEQPAKTDAQRARARRKQAAAKKRRKAALQRTVAEQEATAALEDLSITQ